ATKSFIIDADKCKDAEILVRQLPEAIQEEINEFVCRQRNDLEKILLKKIGDKGTLLTFSIVLVQHVHIKDLIDHFYVGQYLAESGLKQSWYRYQYQATTVRKRGDCFTFVFDVATKVVTGGKQSSIVKKVNRCYKTKLHKRIPGTELPRYATKSRFLTDGLRLVAIYTDWCRSSFQQQRKVFLPEVRTLARRLREQQDNKPDSDLINYSGVVDLDLGETCAAASFYLPFDSERPGVQLTIKRNELYGRNGMNAAWLEDRKSKCGIDEDEAVLACGSQNSSLNKLLVYIRAWQYGDRGIRLRNFYANKSIMRRSWDTSLSLSSSLDKACNLVMKSTRKNVQLGKNNPSSKNRQKPVVFGFGMDGLRSGSRRGAPSSMDRRLMDRLRRHVRASDSDHKVCQVDEYCTSKVCCKCVQNGKVFFTKYLRRLSEEKDQEVIRILVCDVCEGVFRRGGNAAHNIASIASSIFMHHRRPAYFIRP
ncbi:hypothetical protein DFQ30_003003, partial [Apophysomyces sp. BC1015]